MEQRKKTLTLKSFSRAAGPQTAANLPRDPWVSKEALDFARDLARSGAREEAINFVKSKLVDCPRDKIAYSFIAVTYGRMGERTHARQYYDRAIELNPNDAQLHFNKGCSYQDDFEYDLAVQSFERSLALDPSQRDARTNLLFLQYYQLPFDAQNATQKAKAFMRPISLISSCMLCKIRRERCSFWV